MSKSPGFRDEVPPISPIRKLSLANAQLSRSTSRVGSMSSSIESAFENDYLESDYEQLQRSVSIIKQSFTPTIAILGSEDANELARDKAFGSLVEMLSPLGCPVQGSVSTRNSQSINVNLDDFVVRFTDFDNYCKPDIRTNGDLSAIEHALKSYLDNFQSSSEELGTHSLWNGYFRHLISDLPIAPQETFSHPVACLIAISSRNTSPIETLSDLYNRGRDAQIPGYIDRDYLRYYVLLHDDDVDNISTSQSLFEKMKRHFGLHCRLVRITGQRLPTSESSLPFPSSSPKAAPSNGVESDGSPIRIPESDLQELQGFVRDMVTQSVIPFMERCIAVWNDQVASSRRGLSGRFFSASRKYFTSAKSGSKAYVGYDGGTESYPPSSPEAQLRKLADYAFMLQDWNLAHSTYDILRREVDNEKAWRYHAGASEMTVISLLLSQKSISSKLLAEISGVQLESAFYSYVVRCESLYNGVRCLLLASELLHFKGAHAADEAARLTIKVLEAIPSLYTQSAIVAERTSLHFSVPRGPESMILKSMARESGLWSIVAAKAWLQAGERSFALRNVKDASQVCTSQGWTFLRSSLQQLEVDVSGSGPWEMGDEGPDHPVDVKEEATDEFV